MNKKRDESVQGFHLCKIETEKNVLKCRNKLDCKQKGRY